MKSPDELVDMFVGLINKYPAIAALIDPFRKEVRFTFTLRILHTHRVVCIWFRKFFVARLSQ